ncbi:putative cytochrome P450 E-class, group IV [Triangularia verruculosa]|uniref:Cytochrome P450 E-class, group IV n=1 Tax=Triangularia verruculosa TaxID=2587418 RepID=A0AAN6XI30_9PEZI|nr:putative cytochrome P450 E-class, group IV [Triangularia verruculosa]
MATTVAINEWITERPYTAAIILVTVIILPVLTILHNQDDETAAPKLPSTIPYVTNTYHYMTNMRTFLDRSRAHLARTSKNILSFHLTPLIKVYLITSPRHIQALFRPSLPISSDKFFHMIYENLWGAPLPDREKFLNDKSGRGKVPLPGYENTPPDQRYFAALHAIFHDHLAATAKANMLSEKYQEFFGEELEGRFPLGKPVVEGVIHLLNTHMANAAIATVAGKGIMNRWPKLVDWLWEFDKVAAGLVWGLPRWLNRSALQTRDSFRDACGQYVEEVLASGYDLEGEQAGWEPILGSSFQREMVRWMKRTGFSKEAIGGSIMVTMLFGTNANSIPVATWCLIEVIKDKSLLEAVREEVMTTVETDAGTGARTINLQRLLALPLLQSIYVECMRLHVSMNVTREVTAPLDLSGFKLEKGSLMQAATEISHLDEGVWGDKEHPASEFWAERHIRYTEETDEKGQLRRVPHFSMAGRQNDWFPYGGGVSICPGRHFAKQEIMLTTAIIVARFDLELVEWVNKDGSSSSRPAKNDDKYAGAASVPPDREMKVRFTRRW